MEALRALTDLVHYEMAESIEYVESYRRDFDKNGQYATVVRSI